MALPMNEQDAATTARDRSFNEPLYAVRRNLG
jgi:hypothetical protein